MSLLLSRTRIGRLALPTLLTPLLAVADTLNFEADLSLFWYGVDFDEIMVRITNWKDDALPSSSDQVFIGPEHTVILGQNRGDLMGGQDRTIVDSLTADGFSVFNSGTILQVNSNASLP